MWYHFHILIPCDVMPFSHIENSLGCACVLSWTADGKCQTFSSFICSFIKWTLNVSVNHNAIYQHRLVYVQDMKYIDGLELDQERPNYIANALELHLSCTNPQALLSQSNKVNGVWCCHTSTT